MQRERYVFAVNRVRNVPCFKHDTLCGNQVRSLCTQVRTIEKKTKSRPKVDRN